MKAIKAILWMLLTFFMPKEGLNELLRKQRPWQGRACRLSVQTYSVCDLGTAICSDVNEVMKEEVMEEIAKAINEVSKSIDFFALILALISFAWIIKIRKSNQ